MSKVDLDAVIGKCRECGDTLGDTPPPFCTKCDGFETRRVTHVKETNPYKKVWNSVDDEESFLVEQAANNTLFIPTAGQLASRHASKARYLLAQARKNGQRNPEQGREIFEEALLHVKFAKQFTELNNTILERSR